MNLKFIWNYLQACMNALIDFFKEKYKTANKLINTQKNSKLYWCQLYVIIVLCMHFRVNLHSIVVQMSR